MLLVLGLVAVAPTGAAAQMAEISGIAKVYLRAGPGTEYDSIETLDSGHLVDILDVEGSWTKVQTPEGKVGFVYHKYVVPKVGSGSTPATAPVAAAPQPQAPQPPRPTAATPPVRAAAPVASAPAPVPAPATAPAPEDFTETAGPAAPPRDDLTLEVGRLRSEIADLKREIQDRAAEAEETRARGIVSPIPATGAMNAMTAREESAGALAVGFFALIVGWILGSAFTNRRTRSRRPRLRF